MLKYLDKDFPMDTDLVQLIAPSGKRIVGKLRTTVEVWYVTGFHRPNAFPPGSAQLEEVYAEDGEGNAITEANFTEDFGMVVDEDEGRWRLEECTPLDLTRPNVAEVTCPECRDVLNALRRIASSFAVTCASCGTTHAKASR